MNDPTINDNDRLIGTDGGMIGTNGEVVAGTAGATKNFTIQGLREYINSRGSSGSGTGEYDTNLITTTTQSEVLQLFTAHAVYVPGQTVVLTLPPVGHATLVDGAWVRITRLSNTGSLNIYAGAIVNPGGGNRFMAGIGADGAPTTDPHLLTIPAEAGDSSFELIYINDLITIDGTTSPVGWIIVT